MLSKIAFFLSLTLACFTLTKHANAAGNDDTNPPKDCGPLNTIEDAIKQAEKRGMYDGPGAGKASDTQSTDRSVASLHKIIEHDKNVSGFVVEKQTSEVCAYWRNNERVALAALRANKKNIDFISDNLKKTSTKVVKEIIYKRIPMELNLENNIHITAATQSIYEKGRSIDGLDIDGLDNYKYTIKHAKNITPKQKLEFQLGYIRHYSEDEDDDARAIVFKLPLSEEEYRYLFNHIDQKTLLAIVKYKASLFKHVAPEKQTLPVAVSAYEYDKKMHEYMSENLRNNSVIKKMTTCYKKWFPWQKYPCLNKVKKDYMSQ